MFSSGVPTRPVAHFGVPVIITHNGVASENGSQSTLSPFRAALLLLPSQSFHGLCEGDRVGR